MSIVEKKRTHHIVKNEIVEITSSDQFNEILNDVSSNKYTHVFVDFYASWCMPCKRIEPDLKKLCEVYYKIKFLKVNIETVKSLTKHYSIKTMPTFLLFDKSNMDAEPTVLIGAYLDKIEELLKSTKDSDDF